MTEALAANDNHDPLAIVCFGGSAGGFESYVKILSSLPVDTGLAFIIVNHQSSDWKTLLTDILPNYTHMPVVLIEDGVKVKANTVYIVPSGLQARMEDSRIKLSPLAKKSGWPQNISIFLQSLAQQQAQCAIAVILSGLDSDGSAALKPIKEAGGLIIAQDFHTAKHPDMPIHAVDTGCVDFLLSPLEIAEKLQAIATERAGIKQPANSAH